MPECQLERSGFGVRFESLEHTVRLTRATAKIERVVSHNRLLEMRDTHAHDLSQLLARLVREEFLLLDGRSRGVIYHLPGEQLPTSERSLHRASNIVLAPPNITPTAPNIKSMWSDTY